MSANTSTQKLRVGYVPEHFSMPLLQLAESSWGKQHIKLVAQPSGTGQMLTSFNAEDTSKREIDVAIALTEALIAGLAKGRSDYELVGTYVTSSLNWAVITGTDPKAEAYKSINDLRGTDIGISRLGSGSQIMASVMALQHGWTDAQGQVQEVAFKVNDTFANLRAGVNQKQGLETSAFMWEWFTTKPYVDSGEVRFIGNVPTPWPSWTMAATKADGVASSSQLQEFQARLQDSIKAFTEPSSEDASLKAIESHFSYKPEDVKEWWSGVRWVQDGRPAKQDASGRGISLKGQHATTSTVSEGVVTQTLDVLEKAGVVKRSSPEAAWDMSNYSTADRLVA